MHKHFLKNLTGDLHHYRNCNLYFCGDCCGIKQANSELNLMCTASSVMQLKLVHGPMGFIAAHHGPMGFIAAQKGALCIVI